MIVDLPSTTTANISKKLIALRQDVGAMALSRVLTLVVVTDEQGADAAIDTANTASRQHPSRIIVVITATNVVGLNLAQIGDGAELEALQHVMTLLLAHHVVELRPVAVQENQRSAADFLATRL